MKAFISHINEETATAQTLKEGLERALPNLNVFASTIDLGKSWQAELTAALAQAKLFLVLCSPRSVDRAWVNFESGAGWAKGARVIPICHDGLRKEDLPFPLSMFQAIDLAAMNACTTLINDAARALEVAVAPEFDGDGLVRALVAPAVSRGSSVGIVLTHRQNEWDRSRSSPFEFPVALPPGIAHHPWRFEPVQRETDLLSSDLHRFSGLILGAPWRAHMSTRLVTALVRWVRQGGRLLMLGYELGDRHHDGNLGDLAVHFGMQLHTDLVGPPCHTGEKPYGLAVDFDTADAEPHGLTTGLHSIRLANVQTMSVAPGGTEWLRVGRNTVCRPRRDAVDYQDGTLVQPRVQAVDVNRRADWTVVAAEAPPGLCGSGGVQVIGTWEILGRGASFANRVDNLELLKRLLDWLSRQSS